jgi:2-(1,2-epoxy-1,2-dihydrophenyl)acetyl-CoA isomerase
VLWCAMAVSDGFAAAMASFGERYGGQVLWTLRGHTSTVALNRPEAMNTMGGMLNAGVTEALDWCAEEPHVRVVIFTGTGRAFCAGGDLGGGGTDKDGKEKEGGASGGFKGAGANTTVQRAVRNLRQGMGSSETLRAMDKITIAAVNGACAGAGLGWACACDLRFATEKAVFRSAFRDAGLSGDYGGATTPAQWCSHRRP